MIASAADYLETWDDSDSITAVNAQKYLRHPAKWWHNHSTTSQYQGSGSTDNILIVVETELRPGTNNLISLQISNT